MPLPARHPQGYHGMHAPVMHTVLACKNMAMPGSNGHVLTPGTTQGMLRIQWAYSTLDLYGIVLTQF